jgi:hypothetical protein
MYIITTLLNITTITITAVIIIRTTHTLATMDTGMYTMDMATRILTEVSTTATLNTIILATTTGL